MEIEGIDSLLDVFCLRSRIDKLSCRFVFEEVELTVKDQNIIL